MIIVEGADLLGKTTLCSRLVTLLNNMKMPHVYQHLSKLPDCFDPVRDYFPLIRPNVVWDRFHMSRQAYGEVYKNQHVNSLQDYHVIDAKTRLMGTFNVVVVSDSDKFIEDQWAKKNREEMYDGEGTVKVNRTFQRFVGESRYDVDYIITVPGTSNYQWPSDHAPIIVNEYLSKRKRVSHHLFEAFKGEFFV